MSEKTTRRKMSSRAGGGSYDPRSAERNLWAASLSQCIGEMLIYLGMPQTDVGGNTAGYEPANGREALRCLFGSNELYLRKACGALDLEPIVLREKLAKRCGMTIPMLQMLANEPMRIAA